MTNLESLIRLLKADGGMAWAGTGCTCSRCRLMGEIDAELDRLAAEPKADDDEREIPMDSRVRHVLQQWEGTVVAIDTKYEIQRTDGSHVFAWHRELERLPENRGAKP